MRDPVTKLLLRIMDSTGLNQKELAAKLEISEQVVSAYFSVVNPKRPGCACLEGLAVAFPDRDADLANALRARKSLTSTNVGNYTTSKRRVVTKVTKRS